MTHDLQQNNLLVNSLSIFNEKTDLTIYSDFIKYATGSKGLVYWHFSIYLNNNKSRS